MLSATYHLISMLPKKRLRNEAQSNLQTYSRKQQRVSASPLQKNQDIWSLLSKVTQSKKLERIKLDESIKASQIFVRITKSEYLKLPLFVSDLKRTLDSEIIVLHPSFIELKSFSLLQACIVLTAIINHLHNLSSSTSASSYSEMNPGSIIRGSVIVHKSTKVQQTETSQDILFRKATTVPKFKCQLATISSIKGFKEAFLEAASPKDWMTGLIENISRWRFRPVRTNPVNTLSKELAFRKQSLFSAFQEMPFLNELFDESVLKLSNKPLIESDVKMLNSFITELEEYNEKDILEVSSLNKPATSKQSRFSNTRMSEKSQKSGATAAAGSRFQGHNTVSQNTQRNKQHNTLGQKPIETNLSSESVRQYCLATIQASIAKAEEKSSFQIIKTYVKCPRNSIALLQQNIDSIKLQTNCNVVILNLQTIHESTPWFQQLQIPKLRDPPPNLTRVVSVGGVGGKCKKALEMIHSLVTTS